MATHSEFLTALVDALGADRVQVGDTVPARHHTDWSGTPPVPPLALVRPRRRANNLSPVVKTEGSR